MSCVGSRVKYIGNVYGMFYKEGIIVKENADIVQVEFDNGIILYLYKKDVVIIESEDNNMAKLEGYYAVAGTKEGCYGKKYFYAIYDDGETYKKTCPVEIERLQTLPDGYTEFGLNEDGSIVKMPKTRRFEAIGNGWTVAIIAWIFSFMKF